MSTDNLTDDEWYAKYIAGDWIPMSILRENRALRIRLAEEPAILSMAKDAVKLKSSFNAKQ